MRAAAADDEEERAERLRSVQSRIVDLLDSWQQDHRRLRSTTAIALQYQRTSWTQPKPLLREMLDTDFESEHHRKFRVNRSLRDVEPSVNLFFEGPERRQGRGRTTAVSARSAHGQIRRSQVITTWGPGALIDLPRHSGIVGGLDTWPKVDALEEILDPRLTPQAHADDRRAGPAPVRAARPTRPRPASPTRGIGVWRFPEWMVVQEDGDRRRQRARPAGSCTAKRSTTKGRFDGRAGRADPVRARLPARTHRGPRLAPLRARAGGHLQAAALARRARHRRRPRRPASALRVRASRGLHEAAELELKPLGTCRGARPWLGAGSQEECGQPSRLLIRTAANAYFPQVMSALSLPEHGTELEEAVRGAVGRPPDRRRTAADSPS